MKTTRPQAADQTFLITTLGLTAAIAILYLAKVVIMPVAVAVMLAFLLAPLVTRLQRYGVHRVVAIIATIAIAFSIITAIAWTVSIQVVSLAEQLPRYEETLRGKIRQINKTHHGDSPLMRAGDVVDNLRKELRTEDSEEHPSHDGNTVTPPKDSRPIEVEIRSEKQNFIESTAKIIGPFVGPLGTTALIAIFVIAILFQREDLRERVIQLISGGRLNMATEAIDDAAKRVSRYLLMQLLVNATYGIPIGIGLYFIGVPNAFLWGLLAILLRFIPYLGPWLAAFFPLVLAFAIEPGWSKLFMTLGLFLTLEVISNNVIEPWLYGVSTGISNFALMVAAVFWTWLWGPVGLFLSTPLTVCVVVMGNYVPSLKFISVLLGSVPALKPHERLYQRMLAMDYDEMLTVSQQYIKDNSFMEFYDKLLIPALNEAEADRNSGDLAEIRQTFILQNTPELLEELGDEFAPESCFESDTANVLLVPAKDDIDELGAKILAWAMRLNGVATKIHAATSLPEECADLVRKEDIKVVCISAVPPDAFIPARQLSRRLSAGCPGLKCLIGVWSQTAHANDLQRRMTKISEATVVTSIQDAVSSAQMIMNVPEETHFESAPIPEDESKRIKEVHRLNLLTNEPSEVFDNISRTLAKAFKVPISLVSIIDSDRQFWKSHFGLPEDLAMAGESPRETSVCGHVVANNSAFVIKDIAKDKRFANNPFLKSRGIRFYAGVPLRSRAGQAVGSLCVIDVKPRTITETELSLLESLADKLMQEVDKKDDNVN
ncbi:AI-2E family transporter [Alteromonas sp. ASW11-19]|uniref:AI-2E family transporter n=1 Tax=Alteromonas salexigens TaxID=2982530 RepID=A0ABT2VMR7_9ALTE|nr:AI-2E family transporter [Alteromonas salexigens]MCU7554147.1 AI-2E family transporter [Alteromonas salexigens]